MGSALAFLVGLSLLLNGPVRAVETQEGFTAYTEESPPFNFQQGGIAAGIATELLEASCQEAGLHCTIVVMPWARAYHNALNEPNTLLYTTTRTPDRENSFTW